MLFEVTGMKDVQNKTYNIHFVVEAEDAITIKNFLQSREIIILSIQKYTDDIDLFGKSYCQVRDGEKKYRIIHQEEDLSIVSKNCIRLWFPLQRISHTNKETPDDESQKIIHEAIKKINLAKESLKATIKADQEVAKKVYENKTLSSVQDVIDEVFVYIVNIQKKIQNTAETQQLKILHDLEEKLKKLRMWRNLDKIKEVLDKLFLLMDELHEQYLQEMIKNKEAIQIFSNTVVTNIDVIREYHQFKQSQTVKDLWITQNKDDKYYIFSQKFGIIQRFLQNDLLKLFSSFAHIFEKLFIVLEFTLIVIVLTFAWYWAYDLLMYSNQEIQHIYQLLRKTWILWLFLWFFKFFRKEKWNKHFILIWLILVGFFVLKYFITVQFAL